VEFRYWQSNYLKTNPVFGVENQSQLGYNEVSELSSLNWSEEIMTAPKKYIKQMEDILKAAAPEGQKRPVFEWKSVAAARKNEKIIKGLVEELRKLRQQLHDEIEKMHADFAEKKTTASRGTNLSGRGGFMMKKGTMSNLQLVDLRRQELASLFPFEAAQRRIDEEITALDRTKTEIERYLEDASDAAPTNVSSKAAKEDKHG
jgi:hypothetical protein